jgi:hypothetical protein
MPHNRSNETLVCSNVILAWLPTEGRTLTLPTAPSRSPPRPALPISFHLRPAPPLSAALSELYDGLPGTILSAAKRKRGRMEEGHVDGSSGENRGGDPANPSASTQIRASATTVVIVDVLWPAAWRNFREFRGIRARGRSRRHIRG